MSGPLPPRLRPLEVIPFTRGDRRFVAVRDPLGVATGREPRPLPAHLWAVAAHFDGSASFEEVAATLSAKTRAALGQETVEEVARVLSEQLLLDDETFRAARDAALAEFRAQPARAPIGPGVDYPSDSLDLRIRIGGMVADDWDMPTPRGLGVAVAPASGFDRFGRLYSRTYAALRHAGAAFDRVLLLGASPAPLGRALVPLDRPFDTPLGRVEIDAEGFAALAVHPGVDELAHRDALVLERHALFLRLLLPGVPVLPVLVGEPAHAVDSAADGNDGLADAAEAVRRVAALAGRTLVLVAADCSRARAQAEEQLALGRGAARAVRESDRTATDAALALDPDAYWALARAPRPPAHPANPLPLWLGLSLLSDELPAIDRELGPLRGSILGYLQVQSNTDFASAQSLVFHREPRGEVGSGDQRPV